MNSNPNRAIERPWTLASLVAIVLLVSLAGTALLVLRKESLEVEYQKEIAADKRTRSSIHHLKEQIREREDKLAALREEREAAQRKEVGANGRLFGAAKGFDAQVEEWMNRVDRLGRFLQANQRYRIPELEALTAREWLTATQTNPLVTEADYRVALAELRQKAKKGSVSKIASAMGRFLNEAEDGSLSSPEALGKYLDDEIAISSLSRYKVHAESDVIMGIRLGGRESALTLIEKEPIDELWDSVAIVGENSSAVWGLRTQEKEAVEAAIIAYRAENLREPPSGRDLKPYLGKGKPIENLDQLFEAVTTLPSLGPTE